MSEVHRGRGSVSSIQYHIVWCVKYRYKLLYGQIDQDLQNLIRKIAEDKGITIMEMESDKDHIHLLIDCKPQHYIPDIVKALKGVSARLMFKMHPELKKRLWRGHLWNPSYFVATVSENTEEQIKRYIQNQKQK